MTSVGNDVVDLADAGTPSARFVARVLAPAERTLVDRADDPTELVWRLWAAKESAYKLLARGDGELPFAHRRFQVDPAAGVVEHEGRRVRVAWQRRRGLVSCCAFTGRPPTAVATATLDEAEAINLPLSARERAGSRQSRAVRLLAKHLLSRHGAGPGAELEIRRPDRGAPEVWRGGQPAAGVVLSLSHDGRFVGCALAVEEIDEMETR